MACNVRIEFRSAKTQCVAYLLETIEKIGRFFNCVEACDRPSRPLLFSCCNHSKPLILE